MKKIFLIISILLGLRTAYSQDKGIFRIETDTIVFINFNEADLGTQKKMKLLEARQQNRISDTWDLKQFYTIDSKWFKHYINKLNKQLVKGKIKSKFISVPHIASSTGDAWPMTTDFNVEESKTGRNLIIYMTSTLTDKEGKVIMTGGAMEIIMKLRQRK